MRGNSNNDQAAPQQLDLKVKIFRKIFKEKSETKKNGKNGKKTLIVLIIVAC